jgi:hypothetical protein
VYQGIAGITLVMTVVVAILAVDIVRPLFILVPGFIIAYLLKSEEWNKRKLYVLRNVLLDMAFLECRCNTNAIITEAPAEPELVSRLFGKGYCYVCQARLTLKEQFPEAIETEIRERLGEYRDDDDRWVLNNLPRDPWLATGPIPKDLDLAAYLSPVELEWHRAYGQLPEAH